MQYRIQYLDGSANIIRELSADARSGMSAFELVADLPWAPAQSPCECSTLTGARFIPQSKARSEDRTLNRQG